MNFVGVLIIIYFAVKFALIIVLWSVAGPLALLLGVIGLIFRIGDDEDDHLGMLQSVINSVEAIVGALDSSAWTIHGWLTRVLGIADAS